MVSLFLVPTTHDMARYLPAINYAILLCVLISACGIMNPNAAGLLFSDVNSSFVELQILLRFVEFARFPPLFVCISISYSCRPYYEIYSLPGVRAGETIRSRAFCVSAYG